MTNALQHRPEMPELLRSLLEIDFDYNDGDGIDFEPYTEFMSAEDTRSWIQAWTGNETQDGAEYLVFGQDGTGGYAALWLTREGAPLMEQPVVFFGSEGEFGVVACSVYDFMWLLAGGLGPYEAIEYASEREADELFTEFAREHAPNHEKTALSVIAKANEEFPDFKSCVAILYE